MCVITAEHMHLIAWSPKDLWLEDLCNYHVLICIGFGLRTVDGHKIADGIEVLEYILYFNIKYI